MPFTMKASLTTAALMSLASKAFSQIAQKCPSSEICYSLSIPEETSTSGSGDIFFQISASTSYEWVALGQGSGMAGANMFVIYTSSSGGNVTVSPRLGTGNVQPQYDESAEIEVLEGTGVSDGVMTANVRCSSCDTWSGGSMDLSSSSASWIYAWKSGSSLDSDSQSANINQHNEAHSWDWDMSAAVNVENTNPFVTSTSTGGSSQSSDIPSSCTPIANRAGASATATTGTTTTSSTDSDNDVNDESGRPSWTYDHNGDNDSRPPWLNNDNDDNDNTKLRRRQSTTCPAGYAPISASTSSNSGPSGGPTSNTIILAHAVLACLAFVGLFPIGGILIRVANFSGLVWAHAALQTLAYLLYIAAFGLGVYMATHMGFLTRAHPVIGIVLFVVLFAQPLLGLLHHRLFKKYGHRTLWSYVHIGIGRIAILLGIVNGGLGLQLAGVRPGSSSVIAYAVVAAVMGVVYFAAIVFGEVKKRRRAASDARGRSDNVKAERPPRYSSEEQEMEFYGPRR